MAEGLQMWGGGVGSWGPKIWWAGIPEIVDVQIQCSATGVTDSHNFFHNETNINFITMNHLFCLQISV